MTDRSDEIFHFNGHKLTPLPSRSMREGLLGKSLEDALQTLFEKYPQIIPGKQIDPVSDDPPNFVLLRREMPVGGWSLDHLFVDQKATLTLVEAKLFQNPESRREVIGQILEYAANATEFWTGGVVRQKATEFWGNQTPPKELDKVLQEEFGRDLDIENFWRRVEENLRNGRIRLIIATDELRPEMRRIIEYLNKEMQNTEVLGLELKCYGEESESLILVPRLAGQTQPKKFVDRGNVKWTVDKLKTAYADLPDRELGRRLQKILDWAVKRNFFIATIATSPTFGLRGKSKDRLITFMSIGNGIIYIYLNEKHYVGGAKERDELVAELKKCYLLDENLDPQEVISGRNLTKTLLDLSEVELEKLLEIISNYCD